MKKVLSLLLVVLVFLSFTACGASKEQNMKNALGAADATVARENQENQFYSITSLYDETTDTYNISVCADVEYYKSVLLNNPDFKSEYFDMVLDVTLKNADSKKEEISVIMATLKALIAPMFESLELDTDVTLKYINIDGSEVKYRL